MSKSQQSEKVILETALEMDADERTVYLEQTCGGDPQLRQRVESVLAAHTPSSESSPATPPPNAGPTGTILTDGDATVSGGTTLGLAAEESPGDFIGRYKLLEKIGEGGFGYVYVAEQTEPVKRRVALKIIKLGMDTRQVVGRFEAERQALAVMDHPNIAKVLDGGATETGRPYFVMELVRGVKITEHCDKNKLSTHDRLDLFMKVCRAIEHAHQKGIIHRDIKPSNILVTVNDGVPVPKVIDFGIAKATQGSLTEKTVYTQMDQFVGTPAYMSPEQAGAGGEDIDTRTDIYSLGVLLYELLTGETPLESKNLLSRGFDEMRRLIKEWEPQMPSIRLHKRGAKDQTTIASKHGTEVFKLIRMVQGDLDWVVMKCLEKDRSRRYDSAAELTAEIERFLANEPVMARPPSKIYRFQKLVRRNRLAFAAGTIVFVSLVAGLVVTSWFVVKEKSERDMAAKADAVAERDLKIAVEARAQAEKALAQAEAAHQQSTVDQQLSAAAEKRAEAARLEAGAARREAVAAQEQSRQDAEKASLAQKQAAEALGQAQSARQLADAADARAASEAAKREAAEKTAANEINLRHDAETARSQSESALKLANAAREQAETAAAKAEQKAAALWDTVLPARLETLPADVALRAFAALYTNASSAPQLRLLGDWEARAGHWTNALDDFSRAAKLDPADAPSREAVAALMLQTGATNLLLQAGRTNQLADAATDVSRSNYFSAASNFVAAALAQQQLHLTNDALSALGQAKQIIDTKLPKADSGDIGRDWIQWIKTCQLVRQAAAIVTATNAPPVK
jgi:serine/threonine protein kinase